MQRSREGSMKKKENTVYLHTNGGQINNEWEWAMTRTESLRKLEGMRPSAAGI